MLEVIWDVFQGAFEDPSILSQAFFGINSLCERGQLQVHIHKVEEVCLKILASKRQQ